jgi:hypothetical protein
VADITTGTIVPLKGAQLAVDIAGEVLVDGDWIHRKTADQKLWKSDNDTSEEVARVIGMIVYGGGSADDPVCYIQGGPVDLGTTLTPGPYVLSGNLGATCPPADLGSGDFQSQTGYAVSAGQFNVYPIPTGVAKT